MKKIALISLGLLLAFAVNAQDEDKSGSAKKLPKADRLMIGIYQDLWQDTPDGIDVRGVNQGFSFSSMYDKPLGTSKFSLAAGIGIATHNFYSNGSINDISADTIKFTKIADSIDYKLNKFSATYLDIPLELRFRTKHEKKSKQFKIAIGGKIGMLLASHTKYKGNNMITNDGDMKLKMHDVERLEKLRYGASFRVGRGNWNLFGYYSLSQLFEDGKGPEMYPISVGLMLTPF